MLDIVKNHSICYKHTEERWCHLYYNELNLNSKPVPSHFCDTVMWNLWYMVKIVQQVNIRLENVRKFLIYIGITLDKYFR